MSQMTDEADMNLGGGDYSQDTPRRRAEPKPVRLPNGATLYIRPEVIDPSANVGLADLDFSSVREALKGFAQIVQEGLSAINPSKTSVEVALELGLASGGLAAILASGSATASVKITMEWGKGS